MDFQPFIRTLTTERNLSPTSVRAYQSDLTIFSRFLQARGKCRIEDIDRADITSYIDHLKHSPAGRSGQPGLTDVTISRRLAAVSGLLDFTRATSHPSLVNPIKQLNRRIRRVRKCRAVEEEIIAQLLSGITVLRDKAMFALYLSTGLRLSELQQLNRDTITFELRRDDRGRETVTGGGEVIGKGGKLRKFYVSPETVPIYAEYLASRSDDHPALFLSERKVRISTRAIQFTLFTWCKTLGLPHIHPHQLRHTYATRLANAGIDEMQLKDLMGHNDFNTTLRYFKIRDERVAQGYFAAMELYRPDSR